MNKNAALNALAALLTDHAACLPLCEAVARATAAISALPEGEGCVWRAALAAAASFEEVEAVWWAGELVGGGGTLLAPRFEAHERLGVPEWNPEND